MEAERNTVTIEGPDDEFDSEREDDRDSALDDDRDEEREGEGTDDSDDGDGAFDDMDALPEIPRAARR